MHEFALAEAVVTTALGAAAKEQMSSIRLIAVSVGELQQIKKDVFEFALQEVMPRAEPKLADAEVTVDIDPARFRCRVCEATFDMAGAAAALEDDQAEAIHFVPELAHAFLRCPSCRSPDFVVEAGRGVMIETIEGDRE